MKLNKTESLFTPFLLKGIALLLTTLLLFTTAAQAEEKKIMAPDFTLKSRSGENLKLSEFRGKLVMLNFWASWCGPCRQEMPELEALYKRYQSLDFTILGINVDEHAKNAEKMLKTIPVSFPILYDNKYSVSKLYHVTAMPTTVLIDRSGAIRYIHLGYQPGLEETYKEQIEALLIEESKVE